MARSNSPKRRRDDKDERPSTSAPKAKNRRYRQKAGTEGAPPQDATNKTSSIQAQQLAQLEEEVLRNVEEAVTKMVEKEMASEDVQRRIQVRLKEERARLEEQVSIQLDTERAALLEKKRKEQEEVKRKQEELNRILSENKRKLEEAQLRATQEREKREEQWKVASDLRAATTAQRW